MRPRAGPQRRAGGRLSGHTMGSGPARDPGTQDARTHRPHIISAIVIGIRGYLWWERVRRHSSGLPFTPRGVACSSSPSHTPRGSAALRRTPQLFPCERLFPGRRPPPSALPRPCRRRGRPGPRPGRRRPRYASSPHQRATLRALPADPAHTRRAPTSSATTQRTPRGHTVRRALRPLAAPTRLCYPPLHRNRRSSPS